MKVTISVRTEIQKSSTVTMSKEKYEKLIQLEENGDFFTLCKEINNILQNTKTYEIFEIGLSDPEIYPN